jgi:hypothetical protein
MGKVNFTKEEIFNIVRIRRMTSPKAGIGIVLITGWMLFLGSLQNGTSLFIALELFISQIQMEKLSFQNI